LEIESSWIGRSRKPQIRSKDDDHIIFCTEPEFWQLKYWKNGQSAILNFYKRFLGWRTGRLKCPFKFRVYLLLFLKYSNPYFSYFLLEIAHYAPPEIFRVFVILIP